MPIPPEPYLALAVVAVLVVLYFALFGRKKTGRRGSRGRAESDQLVEQLTRIADSLEKLVVRFEGAASRIEQPRVAVPLSASSPRVEQPPASPAATSPRVEEPPVEVALGASSPHVDQPPAPPQKAPEPSPAQESGEQQEQSRKHAGAHITLSMFGR